jgi:polar amino acid transport system substrate-binding protein
MFAALCLLVAACNGDDAVEDPVDDENDTVEPDDDDPDVDDEDADDLGLIEEGTLLVGSDLAFAPFEFIEDGEEQGFDIDLMDEIGERLGVEVEYVDANFDTIFQQLAAGDFDAIISAITITGERAETINFTEPYFEATQALVVPTDSDIAGVDDLADQDVGAQAGTTGLDYANENFTDSTVTEFPDYPAAFTALETGQVDAVLADLAFADEGVQESEDLEIVEEVDTDEQYGIGVQEGNDALLHAIDDALEEIIDDGTYEEIFSEWFPEGEIPEQFAGDGADNGLDDEDDADADEDEDAEEGLDDGADVDDGEDEDDDA